MSYKEPSLTSPLGTLSIGSTTSSITLDLAHVPPVYGDGSDGSVTFDGSSIVLGITPSGNTYTLARDIFLASSTIDNGVSIVTNAFRIFCNGTLTNNGTIQWNGNAGTNTGTQGAQLSNSNGSISNTIVAQSGGAGNTGAGSAPGGSLNFHFGGTAGAGGAGGSSGGSAGTVVAPAPQGSSIRYFPCNIFGKAIGTTSAVFNGGAGGGGGGGDGVNKGGGGGGGGGIVIVVAYLFAGTGNIQALGGNGGDGAVGGTNCGGGGGGGGGIVNITSRSVLSGAISGQTLSVAGGTKGAGTGSGSAGSDGNPGNTLIFYF